MWFKMHPWVFPAAIGGIGILYLLINVSELTWSQKDCRERVRIIMYRGFCFWMFLYVVFFADAFKKPDHTQDITDQEKPRDDSKTDIS